MALTLKTLVRKCCANRQMLSRRDYTRMDSDVLAENQRIERMGSNQIKAYNLVLRNMTKMYGSFLAVNGLSLAVAP